MKALGPDEITEEGLVDRNIIGRRLSPETSNALKSKRRRRPRRTTGCVVCVDVCVQTHTHLHTQDLCFGVICYMSTCCSASEFFI